MPLVSRIIDPSIPASKRDNRKNRQSIISEAHHRGNALPRKNAADSIRDHEFTPRFAGIASIFAPPAVRYGAFTETLRMLRITNPQQGMHRPFWPHPGSRMAKAPSRSANAAAKSRGRSFASHLACGRCRRKRTTKQNSRPRPYGYGVSGGHNSIDALPCEKGTSFRTRSFRYEERARDCSVHGRRTQRFGMAAAKVRDVSVDFR